jgi:hypothetical protein
MKSLVVVIVLLASILSGNRLLAQRIGAYLHPLNQTLADTYTSNGDRVQGPRWLNEEEVLRKIEYPSVALRDSLEDTLTVRILVSETGAYLRHEVQGTLDRLDALFLASIEGVLPRMRFQPAHFRRRPLSVWVVVPFSFRLQ